MCLTVFFIIDIIIYTHYGSLKNILTANGVFMKSLLLKLRAMPKTDIAALVIFCAVFIYLVIVAFFDGTISDEAFYITIPVRLINGDGLFTDEWHLSQLSAVLTYIPVKIFISLTGGTKGIILYIRLLFCLMQIFTGTVIYRTLKSEGAVSVMISISFMLFSVIGRGTLSYNTIGISTLLLLICTAYSLFDNPSDIKMLLSGSLIATFILCQPIGLVFYAIYFIVVCVFTAKKQFSKKETPFPFTLKALFLTIIGILPVLIFFLYLLLKNSDIETIIKCIPGILSDVEHMKITETLGIKTFSLVQFFNDMTMAAGVAPLVISTVCTVLCIFLKKTNKSASVILAFSASLFFVCIFCYRLIFTNGTTETDDVNFILLPLALTGLPFFFIAEKKNHKNFILFWCTGMLYALMMTISSNLRLHASVNGYLIAAAGVLLSASRLLTEIKINETKTALNRLTALLLAIFVFAFSGFHITSTVCTFAFTRSSFKSVKVTEGTYAGIILPDDQALALTSIYHDAQRIQKILSPDDRLFIVDNIPSMYIEGEFKIGAHSGWFIADQLTHPEVRNRFRAYYEIFPENIPDYIYVSSYMYTENGIMDIPPKLLANFAYALFDGETEDIGNGLLIKVTGIKDETESIAFSENKI